MEIFTRFLRKSITYSASCRTPVLIERGVLRIGDTYAITCGEPMGYPGGTNMLKVCEVR